MTINPAEFGREIGRQLSETHASQSSGRLALQFAEAVLAEFPGAKLPGLLTVEQVCAWMRDAVVTENQLRAALTAARRNRNNRLAAEKEIALPQKRRKSQSPSTSPMPSATPFASSLPGLLDEGMVPNRDRSPRGHSTPVR